MTPEEIFAKAIKLPADEQAAFLDEVYKDRDSERSKMEALLTAHEQADSLLDTDAMAGESRAEVTPSLPQQIGDFEVLRELGRGGMGVVYEARQRSLKRKVALKLLSSGLGLSSKAILRFRREAEAAGKLHHTNIVPIYTTGEDRGIHYYAMELIDGPSLDAVIKDLRRRDHDASQPPSSTELPAWVHQTALYQHSPNPPQTPIAPRSEPIGERHACVASADSLSHKLQTSSTTARGNSYFDTVAAMIADVADALDHAHEHGVIHRDVKPSNLLLGPDGRLSINDFGLARMLEQPGMTVSGEFVGSPLYMSPEQITAGRVAIDHRTDIYSLGATLYELLTHQPPFPGETRDQVLSQILHKDPVPPRRINRKLPVDLDTICMKAIDKDPDRRYQTAGQLADDLRAYTLRNAIAARKTGPVAKGLRWVRRNPSWAGLTLAVLMLAANLVWTYQSRRISRLESSKQRAMEYSLRGEFDKAQDAIESAQNSGASKEWLAFMAAQRRLFESDFRQVGGIIGQHTSTEETRLPALCLKAIANLYDGLESEHVQAIVELKKLVKDKELSGTDCLYVSMALMWAEPYAAIDYLDQAENAKINGALIRLLRTHAFANASLDTTAEKDALEYAEKALNNAILARADMPKNQFAIHREFAANSNYALICRRIDDKRSEQFEKRARELRGELSLDVASNNSVLYQYLLETSDKEKAFEFVRGLKENQLVDYLRIYRMFTEIHGGNIESVEKDFDSFFYHREFREPVKQIVLLAMGAPRRMHEEIRRIYENNLKARLARKEFDTLEFSWAVAKLLEGEGRSGDDSGNLVEQNRKKVLQCIQEFEGTYIADIYQPMLDIEDLKPAEVLERSKHSRRRLSVAYFVIGVDMLAKGKPANEALTYFKECTTKGFPIFYTYAFSHAMVERLSDERKPYYWCAD